MARHLSANDSSGSHIHDSVERTAVMFRKDEFRTPSPQLASWHQPRTFDSTAMDDNSNDDFYFHSSENVGCNLRLPDVTSVSYGTDITTSMSGNYVIPPEALDNRYLRCITPELTNSCSFSSRAVKTGGTVNGQSCAGSQFSKSQSLIIDSRSMCILFLFCFYVALV